MRKVFLGIVICLFVVGCGDSFYENVVSIGPMDEISEKTTDSMGNVYDNMSAILANISAAP